MDDRPMPIWLQTIGMTPAGVPPLDPLPMALLEPYAERAKKNHGQTLKQLRDRGGLSVAEAVAIMEDRPWEPMPVVLAVHRLADIIEAGNSRPRA